MYNRDPSTQFELAYNQQDGNLLTPCMSDYSMSIDDHVGNTENIYQSMLVRGHTNIKKAQEIKQTYYIVDTFNNPFIIDHKVLQKYGWLVM